MKLLFVSIFLLSMLLATAAYGDDPRSTSINPLLQQVGIDQKIGDPVPADLVFKDETGQTVHIGDYYHGKPIILTLVYYQCPMLCTLVLNDTLRTLKALQTLNVNDDYQVITVSFDPREGPELAAKKKREYLKQYNRPGAEAGWHFLTGDADNIKKLTSACGFRYVYDAEHDQYIHAGGIIIVTPDGHLSRYFVGVDYGIKDLRLALVEASGNRIGTISDQILLYCMHYDPSTGKYGLAVTRLLRAGAILTMVCLGSFIFIMLRRERRTPPASPGVSPS